MPTQKEIPEMYLYDQGKKTCYGAIKEYSTLTKDIRFGSCSEINFDIAKRYYDADSGVWMDNQIYDELKRHNLVYVADDTKYFSFPYREIAEVSDSEYKMTDRTNHLNQMTFSQNSGLTNFQLQNETRLFNISIAAGYNWQNLSTITTGSYVKKSNWSSNFPDVSCTDFIPVQPYDTIAVRSRMNKGNRVSTSDTYNNTNIKFAAYYIHFYSTNEAASYLGTFWVDINRANPIYRFSVNSLSRLSASEVSSNISGGTVEAIQSGMANGGYIRVSVRDNFNTSNYADTSYPSYYKVETQNSITTTTIAWSFPYDGWLQIYSGERRCTSISNVPSNETYELPMHWFVISEVEEDVDGIMPIKHVKLYSYEYTLSSRSTSLQGGTLPLYIPNSILVRVNSSPWIIDRTTRVDSYGSDTTVVTRGAQYMQRGLLNMILDDLPQWKIGHISSKLMTRYREFEDVDNVGIYTFLMNDVAKAYQCYFVFDNDNMTISAYTQDDIVQNSNIVLNWDNAIKHLNITNSSVNRVTALRVHTADDEYGLGLVNPYGGSTIYNFDSVLDQMDFVADTSMNDPLKRNQILDDNENFVRFRTLKEAVQEMVAFAAKPETGVYYGSYISPFVGGVQINNLSDYRKYAKKFVQANMDLIKAQTKFAEALARYHAVADKINVFLSDDDYGYFIPDKPPAHLSRSRSDVSMYHSRSLYYELVAAVDDYWEAWTEIHTGEGAVNAGTTSARVSVANQVVMYKALLSHVGQKLNLNYRRQRELVSKYPDGDVGSADIEFSILTPAEILALQPYIIEGDWTNENAIFSETYGADDIVDTLADVMGQANSDFTNIYSKDNYDFESDTVNWTAIEEMQEQAKKIKVGQTIYLGTEPDKFVCPILLELHIDYKEDDNFKMTLTTDYNRKPLQFRFADLYGTITQTSVTDSAFTFDE